MTRDNVRPPWTPSSIFRGDANAARHQGRNYWKATSLIAQHPAQRPRPVPPRDLPGQRDVITSAPGILTSNRAVGVKVTSVEVKEVALPDSMKRRWPSSQAERERRAKVVNAEANSRPPKNGEAAR